MSAVTFMSFSIPPATPVKAFRTDSSQRRAIWRRWRAYCRNLDWPAAVG